MRWYVTQREIEAAAVIKTDNLVRGRMLHEWFSIFANSNPSWIERHSIRRNRKPPAKPVVSVKVPWVPAGNWSNEDARYVQRLMRLSQGRAS